MSSIPPHRKPLKRGSLLESHRRLGIQRFNEHIELARENQRKARRRQIAQSSKIRSSIPKNDEIRLILEKLSEQVNRVPLLLDQQPSAVLHIENVGFEGNQQWRLLACLEPNHHHPAHSIDTETLDSLLEQVFDIFFSSLHFESDVERVFDLAVETGASLFPRLIETTLSASPDLVKEVGESVVFRCLCLMAVVIWRSPPSLSIEESKWLSTLYYVACQHHQQDRHPVSLRCAQLAFWSVAILESNHVMAVERAPNPLPGLLSDASESQLIDTAVQLLKLVATLINTLSPRDAEQPRSNDRRLVVDPLILTVGGLSPFGGFPGLCRTLFQVTAAFSKNSRNCLQLIQTGAFDSIMWFLRLVMAGVFAPPNTDPLGVPVFAPDSPLRRGVVDALVTLERSIVIVSRDASSPLPLLDVPRLQEILTAVFTLAYMVLQSHPIQSHHSLPSPFLTPENPQWQELQSIILYDDSDVGLDQLSCCPSDVLVPAIHIIGLLCDYDLRRYQNAQQSSGHQQADADPSDSTASQLPLVSCFIQLDHLLQSTAPLSLMSELQQSRFFIPCLLSRHLGIKHAVLDLLSLLAVAGDPFESLAVRLVPLVSSFLADMEPCFIKRASVLFLLHASFHPDARHLGEILQLDIPKTSSFQSLSRPTDHLMPASSIPPTPCLLCGRCSVIDLILLQFNPQQFDIPLLNMCLDYFEELLNYSPQLKTLLYRHGVIEKIESIQSIDDDDLFHRTVAFVQRYYDDYEDTSNTTNNGSSESKVVTA